MATEYQDFKLNASTGDLDLSGNTMNIVEKNNESLQQRLLMRFSIWEGNWEYDLDLGFPYRAYIGNKVTKAIIDAKIKQVTRLEDDVIAIENFSSTLNNKSRSYSAFFEVVTSESLIVPLAFVSIDEFNYPDGTGGPSLLCNEDGQIEAANKLYYLINFRMPSYGDSTWINRWSK